MFFLEMAVSYLCDVSACLCLVTTSSGSGSSCAQFRMIVADRKLNDLDIFSVSCIGVDVDSSLYSEVVHCMNISCMSCVHEMIHTQYLAHVVGRVGPRPNFWWLYGD